MQKIFIIFLSIFFSCNALSCELNNKKEYIAKNNNIAHIPNIIDFFSFFCPYCYEFKKKYNVKKMITKNIHQNIKVQTYHVNFLGGKFSHILTKSWIIAQQIGIEEKIMIPIFEGIQKTHTIKDLNSIKKIFTRTAGVNESEFNNFWNSLTLKILVHKTNKDVRKFNLKYVPSMLINNKYIIDYSVLENKFQKNFPHKYIELIKFLIHKN